MSPETESGRPIRDPEVLERVRRAFELFELSEEIMLQNLRRRNPEASEEEIAAMYQRWLLARPGAEQGDASGPDFRVCEIGR